MTHEELKAVLAETLYSFMLTHPKSKDGRIYANPSRTSELENLIEQKIRHRVEVHVIDGRYEVSGGPETATPIPVSGASDE